MQAVFLSYTWFLWFLLFISFARVKLAMIVLVACFKHWNVIWESQRVEPLYFLVRILTPTSIQSFLDYMECLFSHYAMCSECVNQRTILLHTLQLSGLTSIFASPYNSTRSWSTQVNKFSPLVVWEIYANSKEKKMLGLGFQSESSHPIYPIRNDHRNKIHFLCSTYSELKHFVSLQAHVHYIFVVMAVIMKLFISCIACCFISGNFEAMLMSLAVLELNEH